MQLRAGGPYPRKLGSPETAAVSVVIVSHNTQDLLETCLEALYENNRDLSLDVWVVDNASADDSVEIVRRRFPNANLVVNSANHGFARAANQALAQAQGDFLALLNPDSRLIGNSLLEMVRFLKESPQVGIVGGAVTNADGTVDPASHRGLLTPFSVFAKAVGLDRLFPRSRTLAQYNMRWLRPTERAEVRSVSGSFLMIRREALEVIGLLDERFFLYAEDHDWCMRAGAAGWKVFFLPQAGTIHRKGASTRQHPEMTRLAFHQSFLEYYKKHWSRLDGGLKRWLVYLLVYIHSGFDRRIFLRSDAAIQLFQNYPARIPAQKARAVSSVT